MEESLAWQLYFPGGAVANSFSTYATGVNRLYAAAEKGWYEVNNAYGYGGQVGRTSKGPMEFTHINQQAAHMDGVARSILTNTPNNVPGEEGLRDMKVIEAIYASIAAGGKDRSVEGMVQLQHAGEQEFFPVCGKDLYFHGGLVIEGGEKARFPGKNAGQAGNAANCPAVLS